MDLRFDIMKVLDNYEVWIKQCGLGEVIEPPTPVSGGFLHRMYKMVTDQGCFALKHLNSEIMRRPDAKDNFARAEKIERILEENKIPIVPAMVIDQKKLQQVGDDFFYIFKWQEGAITDWNHILEKQCFLAGNILGKMHCIQPQKIAHREPEICEIDWKQYIEEAKESEIAGVLQEAEDLLYYAQNEVNKARKNLPDLLCISDEDMDPKNVMWCDGKPKVIDLECLDYGNPVSHVLQLSLQWSGITTCEIKVENIKAFFEGYLQAYDNGFRGYAEVFGLAYTWIEWLEYNVKRALGNCMDEDERNMGISQVKATIERIRYINENESLIRSVLERVE